MAHHGVKRDIRTTPVRIVFDCSAKRDASSPSLNDCLWTGPTLTLDLVQVLLRFRLHQFACARDIEKAFLMVPLREDRNYSRFLWFKNMVDPSSNLIICRLRVVLFGAKSSPFLLNATIRKHLSISSNDKSDLNRGLYVNNLIHMEQTESDLIQFFHDSSKVFADTHLFLKEWISNSPELQILVTAMGVAGEIKDVNRMLSQGWNVRGDVMRLYGHVSSVKVGYATNRICEYMGVPI